MTKNTSSRSGLFFRERLEFYLRDVCGYSYDVVKAVLAADADDVVDALARAEALKQVMHMPEFQAIGAACKRMRNILRQAEEKGIASSASGEALPDSADEEKNLIAYLEREGRQGRGAFAQKKEYVELAVAIHCARASGQFLRQGHGDGRR